MRRHTPRRALPRLALLTLLPVAAAAEPARTGPEFQANVVTLGMQRSPDVALGPDGTSLVVWRTDVNEQPPGGSDVRGRFFDASGTPLTDELSMHTALRGIQTDPRTATDGQGNFLVLWREDKELFARSFQADGRPWSTEVRLSSTAEHAPPAVAGDPNGGFIVAWLETGRAIRASRLSGRGVVLGQEAEVRAAIPSPAALRPEVAAAPDGGFAVTWSEVTSTSSQLFVRLYGPSAQPRTGPVLFSSPTPFTFSFQGEAVPVFHPDGSFSVVWMREEERVGMSRLYARRFDSAGRPGSTIPLTPASRLSYSIPLDVASDPDGTLLLIWVEDRTSSTEVFGRTFDATWRSFDEIFRVNTYTGDYQMEGAVAAGAAGRFLSVWGSGEEYPSILPTGAEGYGSQDGHFFGVFGQALSTRCVSGNALCLAGGRFKVEVDWSLPVADGRGHPVPLTDDTGAFWFFGPGNLELLVKVLDGRPVNGHFWVFFGGLSDVRFTVTVTDTETGERRVYPHAAGTLASQADTTAFAVTGDAVPASPRRETLIRADRLGGELAVNALTSGAQMLPAVAAAADGSFLATWLGPPSDRPAEVALFVRAFDPSGAPRTGDFQITPTGGGVLHLSEPRVAALPSGRFLVVWRESLTLYGHLFDSLGAPVGGRLQISPEASFGVSVAATGGGFIVAWQDSSRHLRAQRLDSSGARIGPAVDVASPAGTFSQAEVAASPSGGFAVAWIEHQRLDRTIRVRRFDAAGQPLGDALAAGTEGDRAFPVYHPDGRLSVLWTDGWKRTGTFVRTLDTAGSFLGPAVRLPSPPRVTLDLPALAADAAGTLLLTWQEEDPDGSGSEVYGRFFDATWRSLGGPFQVNTFTDLYQTAAAVAAAGPGRFVAVWTSGIWSSGSPSGVTQDGSSFGIFGQRLDAGCLASAALCLGNGRFRVEVAWKTPDGGTGSGHPVPLTDDTGTFWFFGEDNHELMVKVIDGRPVNGRFWVFYGALSDVEYTLTVIDTVTGARRTYRNPAGSLASQADTSAFTP